MKRLIAISLTIAIVVIIYSKINREDLLQLFFTMDFSYFYWAMFLFIPQIMLAALRWKTLSNLKKSLKLWESTKLTLAGNTLNVLLPSKAGDMVKAFFLKTHFQTPLSHGISLVIIEKILDIAALSFIMLLGIIFLRQWNSIEIFTLASAIGMLLFIAMLFIFNFGNSFLSRLFIFIFPKKISAFINTCMEQWVVSRNIFFYNPYRAFLTIFYSLVLWFLHVTQIYLFFYMFGHPLTASLVFGLVPMAIFFGLLPLTVGGIGTRDSALIYLFSPYLQTDVIVAMEFFAQSAISFLPCLDYHFLTNT